ncbi:MAG TPA: protein kinase, partial [Polyangia bacterium]|nr:protein kinase [Polyangia bacterium]
MCPTENLRRPPQNTPVLEVGRQLAGRYRIVRFIARGGMSEVYEAEDLELGERLALKVLLRESDDDRRALERFKREVQLARRVTHPNVCRIFDFGIDTAGSAPIAYLTMELLDGESLRERLTRGAMTVADALPVVVALAEALHTAHEAGVIHRDFKSSNVMLVGNRVVVTDFGLARPSERLMDDSSLSRDKALIGSPKYMAPEQVEGLPVTQAADLYALGVVAFEMLTGRLPFVGETPLQSALKRLVEPPPSLRSVVRDVPESWDAAVTRCLARDPQARFVDARDFVHALRAPSSRPRRAPRPLLAVVASLLVVGTAIALRVHETHTHAVVSLRNSRPMTKLRRSVGVMGFDNLTRRGQDDWIGTAFAEMLSAELGASEDVRTIDSETVSRVKRDLALANRNRYDAATLSRLRRALEVDWVVSGSFAVSGTPAQLRLDLSLQDARTGDTIVTPYETGASNELIDIVERAGVRLREALGLASTDAAGQRLALAPLPTDGEAARLYAQALVHRRASDSVGALTLVEQAIARDPKFALAHSVLGETLLDLGRDNEARAELERAGQLSTNLPREDRLLLEARWRAASYEWQKAIDLYRALFAFFPDNLQYGLSLARAQYNADHTNDALATIADLRKLPKPLSDDPWIDLREGDAYGRVQQWKLRLQADQRAIDKGRALGTRLLVADAERGAGEALSMLGRLKEARAMFEDAEAIATALGDRRAAIEASVDVADILAADGDLDGSRKRYLAAVEFYRRSGSENGLANMLDAVGGSYQQAGELKNAMAAFDE